MKKETNPKLNINPNKNKIFSNKSNHKKNKKIFELKFDFNIKNAFVILFIAFFIFSIFSSVREINKIFPEKPLTTAIDEIKKGEVKKVEIIGNKIILHYKNSDQLATTTKEPEESFIKTLKESGVDPKQLTINIKDTQTSSSFINILFNIIPTILMIAFFVFLFRQARGTQDSIFSFGQSRAKMYTKEMSQVKFTDVAGVDEAKKELEEVVDFLKNPQKYSKLGARTPKGVILVGPSGCGKTLLAKAVAGESNVPFFSIAGSEFMEMFVGIGAARVRDLFAAAKKNAPAIIFIDEIDAIGRTRSIGAMPAHDEREQTLNQILVEMDGFAPNEQVIVIAATNRGDLLDPALLRPGRFDRKIVLDYPDIEGRKAILKIHAKGKPFSKKLNWEKVAKRTVGFSGADIENMLNEAAILAARTNRQEITMEDIEEAATKVKLGPEKKRLQSQLDKKITAYHEAGHAIVTHFLPNMDPVHRISIVSRGMSLGYTLIPPTKDRLHETKTHLLQEIISMMGGRAAEKLIFNEITTGAASDFDQATRIARAMVIEFGMSNLGPINFGPSYDVVDWGRRYYEQNSISQSMLSKIDSEVKKIIDQCYQKAEEILIKNRVLLDKVAEELINKESLDDEDFEKIVGPKPKEEIKI